MSRIIAPLGLSGEYRVAGLVLEFDGGVSHAEDLSDRDARRLRSQGFIVDTAEPDSAPAEVFLAPGEDGKPSGNASKSDWEDYAVSRGHFRESLEELSRDQIRDLFKD